MEIKTMRIYITENCNAKCENCFNAETRTKSEINTDMFDKLCVYLKDNGIKNVKIMGGEPTVHHNFSHIIEIAQKHFESVNIFTNGTQNKLQDICLREKDNIIYNFNFAANLTNDRLLLDQKGKRSLEVQVMKKTDEKKLLNNIQRIAMLDKVKIHVSLTLDCMSNIFIDRKMVVSKLLYLQEEMDKNEINYSYDHKIPFCYLYKSGLKLSKKICSCSINTAGLIDADLNLRFCNQYSDELLPIYQNNAFLPWRIAQNYILQAHYKHQINALEKICLHCVFYDILCNGGCWIAKNNISREDIFVCSDFPVMEKKNLSGESNVL